MDTELARTFLTIVACGSFVDAGKRLNVTQSTISSRIQRLEATLGAELFVRNRAGASLTAAGRQFQRHASLLTRTVEQARQQIGAAGGYRATISIGSRLGLWQNLLLRWLPVFRGLAPDVAVRATIGLEDELMPALVEGRSDIALLYTPHARPGLTMEPLLEEQLVMIATRRDAPATPGRDFVFVDWGPEFSAHLSLAFPDYSGAALTVNMAWLGLEYVLAHGGSGYFPVRLIRDLEFSGQVHRVTEAPDFRLPAYLCFPTRLRSDPLALAIDTIRRVAGESV